MPAAGAAPKGAPVTGMPVLASAWLPPAWSASALVLMISPIGPIGDGSHRLQDLIRHVCGAAVHQYGRIFPNMYGNVGAGAEDHVDVRTDLDGLKRSFALQGLGSRHDKPTRGNGGCQRGPKRSR